MKRYISTITLVCAGLLLTWDLSSQSDTVVHIPDINISDQRIQMPFSQSNRTIHFLTRQDIDRLPAQSIQEILSFLPGVDIRNRGIKGSQADISLRGSTFEQVLVMVNGVKVNDPQTGHHSLNIPVPLESVERIEVLKGPGSRRYGQNSLAGAINIITRVPTENQTTMRLEGGSYGTIHGSASTTLGTEEFRHLLNLSHIRSDGYRYNTDFKTTQLFYQNEWNTDHGKWSLLAGHTDRKFGANGFYASPTYVDQYEEIQTTNAVVGYSKVGNHWHIKPSLYWRRNQDEYLLVRGQPEVYRNLHKTHTLGAEIQSGYHSSWGLTGVGVELRALGIQSNNLGDHQRREGALFLEHRWESGRLSVTPGFNINYFSDFGTFFYPGVDVGYAINRQWNVYANAGQTYRIPTYTDLYYVGPTNIGNELLEPEEAMTYEAGVKYLGSRYFFNAAYYLRDSRNLIDWVKDREEDPWMPQNFYHARIQGVELENRYRFPRNDLNLSQLKIFYTYVDARLVNSDQSNFSRYALDNLRHQALIQLDGQVVDRLSYNVTSRYLDRVNLADYVLLDAQIQYQLKRMQVWFQINNITDQQYTETSGVPMPGRWYNGGVSMRLVH